MTAVDTAIFKLKSESAIEATSDQLQSYGQFQFDAENNKINFHVFKFYGLSEDLQIELDKVITKK